MLFIDLILAIRWLGIVLERILSIDVLVEIHDLIKLHALSEDQIDIRT